MAKSKKPVKKTTAPKRAVVSSVSRRKPVKVAKVTRKPSKPVKVAKVTRKPSKPVKVAKVTRKPSKPVKVAKVTRKPVKPAKVAKVTRKPSKPVKVAKVTRKPSKPVKVSKVTRKTVKPVKVTKRAIKEKKIKVVNPKTGRKKTVKPVTEIEQLKLTTPQTEKFVNLKPFSFSDLNTGVVDKIFFFNSEFQTSPTVTWGGQTVPVTNEQLLELVNRLNTSYHNYAEKKKIPSPLARWKSTIDPANGTANLNIDGSFFGGDEDEPFDPSDIFFDMF